jgi:hypothetical protein
MVITLEIERIGSLLWDVWCCGLYFLWLNVKISVLPRLRTKLIIHLT